MTLDEYLKTHDLPEAEFGRRIGRDQSFVHRLRKNSASPSWATITKIKEVTDGEVQPNDFLPATEQREAAE